MYYDDIISIFFSFKYSLRTAYWAIFIYLFIFTQKAILDKATSHTKLLLQKSEERNKALEKVNYTFITLLTFFAQWGTFVVVVVLVERAECIWCEFSVTNIWSWCSVTVHVQEVNALQWEITFNQVQFKNLEHAWELKYDR